MSIPVDTEGLCKTIGERTLALRISRGLKAADLAERMGISINLLTRIETGRSNVTARDLYAAATALGVKTTVLTGEEPYEGR